MKSKITVMGLLQAAAACLLTISVADPVARFHFVLELLVHFKLQYAAISLVFAVIFVAAGQRGWSALMALTFAINAAGIAPWYSKSPSAPSLAPNGSVKLLLANVHSSNTNTAALLSLIEAERPDIVIVQELNRRWADAMQSHIPHYPARLEVIREDNFGLAAYATHAWQNSEVVSSQPFRSPTLVLDYAIGNQVVRLAATHPPPPVSRQAYDARNGQFLEIAPLLSGVSKPAVLVGDLNSTMWSPSLRDLAEAAGLSHARRGFGLFPSWPTWLWPMMIPIDHCLHSAHFRTVDVRTGPDIGSDHLPMIFVLELMDSDGFAGIK